MTDVTISLDDTLELDTIIKQSSTPIQPINSVKHDKDGSSHKNDFTGFQTNTAVFDPPKPGTYTIKINGQELSVKVKDPSTIPDPVTEWTTAGDSGFTISTGDPLSVSHDDEGAGDAGGMASEYITDLTEFANEIVDVEFRNIDFDKNSTGQNNLVVGFGDISPDQPARRNGNGIYYMSDVSGSDDALNLVESGSEDRKVISPVDWSNNHDVTVRIDDTGSSTVAELLIDGSQRTSRSYTLQSGVSVIFQLFNNESLSNSCNIGEVGIIQP